MIKFEKTEVWGIEHAIRGMRNSMNSWDRSDSCVCSTTECRCRHLENNTEPAFDCDDGESGYCIGENDFNLAKKLIKAGSEHRKFLRQIFVSVDITAPLYWWKEFDTYKVGTTANSSSTMHKIHSKEIELSDFSIDDFYMDEHEISLKDCFYNVVADCETLRKKYVETKDKRYWRGLIQLLPTSYNQKRTVTLNYENLLSMYQQRKNHKLDEWRVGFVEWVKSLSYSELLM